MRKVLLSIGLIGLCFCTGATLYAQDAPRPAMSVMLSTTTKQIIFRLSWVERITVDSTVISVYTTADTTTPVLVRRGISPDTISLPAPDDTIHYQFRLQSYLNSRVSSPAEAQFYFNAASYFRMVRLITKPDTILIRPGQEAKICTFAVFSDSTVVMRDRDKTDPVCSTQFLLLPNTSATGYKQRITNTICFRVEREDGTVEQEPNCP